MSAHIARLSVVIVLVTMNAANAAVPNETTISLSYSQQLKVYKIGSQISYSAGDNLSNITVDDISFADDNALSHGSAVASSFLSGTAGVGSLKAFSSGLTTVSAPASAANAFRADVTTSMDVSWRDRGLVQVGSVPGGGLVTLQGFLKLTGRAAANLTQSGAGSGESRVLLRIAGTGITPPPLYGNGYFFRHIEKTGAAPIHIDGPLFIPWVVTVPNYTFFEIVLGMELDTFSTAEISTSATHTGGASGIFDGSFSETLTFGGITSATDAATGLPVPLLGFQSLSGFDYINGVPEPGSFSLFALAALAAMRRRRAR